MTVSKKLIKLEKLLKKSEELSTKLAELNNDENEFSNSTINSKKQLKSDIKIINKIMKEFKETHERISELTTTISDKEKEELKKLDLKI